jgi:DNA-directed RNA polymerase specialized sigma24 family protein
MALHNGVMSDVTRILSQIESGDPSAAEQLLPLVYDELRKLAAAKLAHEKPGQTLQATALVHEAYLRLVESGIRDQESGGSKGSETNDLTPDSRLLTPVFDSRGHFFAAAAEAMRRILVDAARRKQATKRGGGHVQPLLADVSDPLAIGPQLDLLALDDALTKFAARDPLKAQLVKLRFFAGQTMPQAAQILGISLATAERHWTFARTWLYAELAGDDLPARKMAKNRPSY